MNDAVAYLLLLVSILLGCCSSILGGYYNRRAAAYRNTSSLYTLLKLATIFVFWAVRFAFDGFAFDVGVLPYALGLAVCFFSASIGLICALRTGSTVISTLLLNMSSILVSIWGIFFWGAEWSVSVVIGLLLVAASVALCLFKGKKEDKRVSPLWLFCLVLLFFGNAGCSIIMKSQQLRFNDLYSPFLMMVAIGLCTVAAAIVFWCGDRRDAKAILRAAWHFPVIEGIGNGLMNLIAFVLFATALSSHVIFPARGVATLILVTVFSSFIFKEKLRPWQWGGVVAGIAAVGILAM